MYRGDFPDISYFSLLLASFIICYILIYLRSVVWRKAAIKIFNREDEKAQSCLSKIFFYGLTSIYGYVVLQNEPWSGDVSQYHKTVGRKSYPLRYSFYYLVEFSFYLTEFLYLLSNYDKKDRKQLIVHHLVTLSLLVVSFFKDYSRIGIVIMGLHDVSDPLLESSKLFIYMNRTVCANIGFCIFTIVFVLSRIFFYPYWILYPTLVYLKNEYSIEVFVCAFCLFMLYGLHIYWTIMIGKTFKKIFVNHEYKDARSKSVINQNK